MTKYLLVLVALFTLSCAEKDTVAPGVVNTVPINGANDVDPSLTEISVTFNEEMQDGNWSWAYTTKDKFPEMTGRPVYSQKFTKNTLPIKLEPNKEYEVWINSQKFGNFKDKAGNSAEPFKLTFKTR